MWFLQEVVVQTFNALCNNEKGFKKKLTEQMKVTKSGLWEILGELWGF